MIAATQWSSHRTTSSLWAQDTLSKHNDKDIFCLLSPLSTLDVYCCCWYSFSVLRPLWVAQSPDDRSMETLSVLLAARTSACSRNLPWKRPCWWSDFDQCHRQIHFRNHFTAYTLKIKVTASWVVSPGGGTTMVMDRRGSLLESLLRSI